MLRIERLLSLADVDLVATAVGNVCSAGDRGYRRVNVDILANRGPFLYAHIWPRYDWEPAEMVGRPVWLYSARRSRDAATALSSEHSALRAVLATELVRLYDVIPGVW